MDFVILGCFLILGIWGLWVINNRIDGEVERLKKENSCLKLHITNVEDRLDKLRIRQPWVPDMGLLTKKVSDELIKQAHIDTQLNA